MGPCDSGETFTFLSSFAPVNSTFEAAVPSDFLPFRHVYINLLLTPY